MKQPTLQELATTSRTLGYLATTDMYSDVSKEFARQAKIVVDTELRESIVIAETAVLVDAKRKLQALARLSKSITHKGGVYTETVFNEGIITHIVE